MGNLKGGEFERRARCRTVDLAGDRFGIENPDIALILQRRIV